MSSEAELLERGLLISEDGLNNLINELERRTAIAEEKQCPQTWKDLAMFVDGIRCVFAQIDEEVFADFNQWHSIIQRKFEESLRTTNW